MCKKYALLISLCYTVQVEYSSSKMLGTKNASAIGLKKIELSTYS